LEFKALTNGDYFHDLSNFFNRKNSKFINVLSQDITYSSPFSDHNEIEAVKGSLMQCRNWLDNHSATLTAVNLVKEKDNPLRAGEALISLKLNGKDVLLPFAFALNVNANNEINEIRFYHSYWPIESKHHIRPNIFPLDKEASRIPTEILDYHSALNDGNIEVVLSLFADGASVREPSGGISGPGRESILEDFFSRTFRDGGGVSLVYHTIVDGNTRCAAEYSCTKWGQKEIPPQAGIEFFDRVSEGEKRLFNAVRIYDDIEQPTTSVEVQ
jgi:hypothetical protein